MASSLLRRYLGGVCLLLMTPLSVAQKPAPCRVAIVEGEVKGGESFVRPIGNGLSVMLEALASGWIVRVLPATGPRDQHDYAELATPPYRSVSPLLISTDFSFRAQDAIAWNPRHFHFASDRASFLALQRWYGIYQRSGNDLPTQHSAELKLAQLAAETPDAALTILDARLVQGTADQAGTAATVATHLNSSAHEVDQPVNDVPTPLGRLNAIKFRIQFDLPKSFTLAAGVKPRRGSCL